MATAPRKKRNLAAPAKRAPISLYAATKLAKERAELDAERLEFQREAANREKLIAAIDVKLIDFVDAYKEGKERTFPLKHWRLRIVTKFKSLFYKAELEKEIGTEEMDKRSRALGSYDKLEVDPIGE